MTTPISFPAPDPFQGWEYRHVKGSHISTESQVRNSLGLIDDQLHAHKGFRGGESVWWYSLEWPLWFRGEMSAGKIIVGDTLYGPGPLHIPAAQHFEIVEPIAFSGVLRTRRKE